MKLQQLRFLCEIVDRELSISNAAAALHTSQPSVSRQIQALEKELGVAVFARIFLLQLDNLLLHCADKF